MKISDNITDIVRDDLRKTIERGSNVSLFRSELKSENENSTFFVFVSV